MFAGQARILIDRPGSTRASHKSRLLDVANVIGNQVVAQPIAFVDRAPQLPCRRVDSDARWIADARRINPHEFPFRRIFQNVGTMRLARMIVRIVQVGCGTNSNKESLAIQGERQVPRPVAMVWWFLARFTARS